MVSFAPSSLSNHFETSSHWISEGDWMRLLSDSDMV
jgi:hypothetical protein